MATLKPLRVFGSNYLRMPWSLFVDKNKNLVVTEFSSSEAKIFSNDGTELMTLPNRKPLVVGDSQLPTANPRGVVVDKDGRIILVDGGNHRVQVFG